jgi:predicted amidophosphoribosyltransferase
MFSWMAEVYRCIYCGRRMSHDGGLCRKCSKKVS